jgi:NRAMP (natural resistance-associated macrophage protein)-like metal ion transporter
MEKIQKEKLLTISQLRHELGIPLVVAKKLILKGEIKIIGILDGKLRIHENEIQSVKEMLKRPGKRAAVFIKTLGPGLITGVSDDDPSGIGTYSSVGAQFGYSIIWMAAWLLPVMLAIQEICARIGIVTNKGLAGVLLKHYRKKYVALAVILLLMANIVNIGADLGAMAASFRMLTNFNFYLGVFLFALISIAVEVFVGYHIYVKFLKWLTISVFAYIATGIIIHPDWTIVVKEAFIPQFQFSQNYIFAMIAVFGTTITPYLFFWQASEEVEENKLSHKLARKIGGNFYKEKKADLVHGRIGRMRTDVGAGMILANVVFFFIVLTTAQVLFRNGIFSITSPEEAALALRPLAGDYAYFLFAAGIIGTGLLAVPILAGSGAYALSEIMKWREGLELKFHQARGFYLVIIASILFGMFFNFFHINPILALYWSAFINGIIALPLLVVIMVVGNDAKIMGRETHPGWIKFFGWLAVIFMALAIIASLTALVL